MVLFLARLTSVLIFFGSRGKMANSLEHCFLQTQQRAKHPFLLEAQWHRFSFQGGYGARWSLAGFCITGMLAPTVHWLLRLYLISKDLIPTCRLLGRSSSYLILLQWILKGLKGFLLCSTNQLVYTDHVTLRHWFLLFHRILTIAQQPISSILQLCAPSFQYSLPTTRIKNRNRLSPKTSNKFWLQKRAA